MKHPKLAAATAALVVLVTAAGCTSDGGAGSTPPAGPSASGPAPTAPTAVLAAAAQRVDQQSYRLSLGDGAGGDGTTLVGTPGPGAGWRRRRWPWRTARWSSNGSPPAPTSM